MNKISMRIALLALAILVGGCGKKEADKPAEKLVNITTATVQKKDLSVVESAVGSSTSLSVAQALDPTQRSGGKLSVRLPFPEHVARQLRIGQSVRLTSFDQAAKTATAYVKEIRPALNSTTQTMEVIAELRAGHEWYSVGSVQGEVVVGVHRGALVVPEQAVVLRPAGSVVYVTEGDTVMERVVKQGIAREGEIEIVTGLKLGEIVAVDGASMLSDGAKVMRREPASAAATPGKPVQP